MQPWSQIFVQARDLLNNLRPAQRLTLVAVPLLVASCLALFAIDRSDSYEEVLVDGQPVAANDLDAARAALDRAGLRKYRIENQRLLGPRKELSRYGSALRSVSGGTDRRQPVRDQRRESGFSFLRSDHERQAQADEAKASDLENEIRKHPAIESARLFVDRGRMGSWSRSHKMTASLILVPRDGTVLPDELLGELRSIVAHAYSGLATENVVVSRQQLQTSRPSIDAAQQVEQQGVSSASEHPASRPAIDGTPSRADWPFELQLPEFLRDVRSTTLAISCAAPLGTALACIFLLWWLRPAGRRLPNVGSKHEAAGTIESSGSTIAAPLGSPPGDPRIAISRIQQLVRNDPAVAAGIITGWIAAET